MKVHFDRGTLVLHAPRGAALNKLPAVRWDDRIAAYRAPAYRYRSLLDALRERELRIQDEVMRRREGPVALRAVALRPYQRAALEAWQHTEQGLVVLPTGSGKTRLACAAIAACGVSSLCLVPTRALLHQWSAEIACHYTGVIGCLGDGQRRVEAITVATFESAYRLMPRLGDRFELLVVDEAHHFGAGIRDEALEMCAAARRLALTATAPGGETLSRLAELMGPTVMELRVSDLAGLWLADFELIVLKLRLSVDERRRYADATRCFRDSFRSYARVHHGGTWRDYVAFASSSEQGRQALAAYRASRRMTAYPAAKRAAVAALLREHRAQRVLVFVADNATAYEIAREHLIMPLTCDIDRAERESALRAFCSGELRALVSAQVLNEGLDVPDAEVAIIVAGAGGEREHVQRVGRLLRPAPGKHALVYELVALDTHEVSKAAGRRRALTQPGGRPHA